MSRTAVIAAVIVLMLLAGLTLSWVVFASPSAPAVSPSAPVADLPTPQPAPPTPAVAARQDGITASAPRPSAPATAAPTPTVVATQPLAAAQAPTEAPAPTETPAAPAEAPTPTPAPAASLSTWQITPPGCCPGARWTADSSRVTFYRQPADGPAGLWSADLAGQLTFLQPRFGHLSANDAVLVSSNGGQTLIEGMDGSQSRVLENRGVETLPSPDGAHVAYFDRHGPSTRDGDPQDTLMVAAVAGGEPVALLELARADHLRWFPDSQRLAVFGWRPEGVDPGLWVVDIATGASQQIVQANFLTALEVAPDGAWIAYLATLQPNPADSGLWIVRPDGSERRALDFQRAARWAADSQALLALMPAPGGKELARIDIATGQQSVIASRDQVDFDVEADDWLVAPDGRHIVYRSPRDRALWVLHLAP